MFYQNVVILLLLLKVRTVMVLRGTNLGEEERRQIKHTIINIRILHEKLKSRIITEPHANTLYYQRDYMRRRDNCIYNA